MKNFLGLPWCKCGLKNVSNICILETIIILWSVIWSNMEVVRKFTLVSYSLLVPIFMKIYFFKRYTDLDISFHGILH